jgi:hypothetical protein
MADVAPLRIRADAVEKGFDSIVVSLDAAFNDCHRAVCGGVEVSTDANARPR